MRDIRDAGELETLDAPQVVQKRGTILPRYTVAGWVPRFRQPGTSDCIGIGIGIDLESLQRAREQEKDRARTAEARRVDPRVSRFDGGTGGARSDDADLARRLRKRSQASPTRHGGALRCGIIGRNSNIECDVQPGEGAPFNSWAAFDYKAFDRLIDAAIADKRESPMRVEITWQREGKEWVRTIAALC